MRKIMRIKEWLENRKLVGILENNAAKSPLLDNLVSVRPFDNMPLGHIIYLDARYQEVETITGELPFED